MQDEDKVMIQNETVMTVADNSGARKAMCIKVLGGSHRRYATVGDKIVVAIKEAIPRGKVQKGTVFLILKVRTPFSLTIVMPESTIVPIGIGSPSTIAIS